MPKIILDPEKKSPTQANWIEIRSEMDFLCHSDDAGILLIRGSICDWAQRYYQGRGIAVEYATSQVDQIRQICPLLNDEQASDLLLRYSEVINQDLSYLSLSDLLNLIIPDEIWEMQPSADHFARYLLWLYLNKPTESLIPLVKYQSQKWSEYPSQAPRMPYELAFDFDSALSILQEWLCIKGEGKWRHLGVFQSAIPRPLIDQAREEWKRRIIESKGEFFTTLLNSGLPRRMLCIAAEETFEYFESHPSLEIGKRMAERLLPYLDTFSRAKLLRLIPPARPNPLPVTTGDVITWVIDEYLPYREWQSGLENEEARQIVLKSVTQFAKWYLDKYPTMLLGADRNDLSYVKVEQLKQNSQECITLMIILDGLSLYDARIFHEKLIELNPSLTLVKDEASFAPLPTVTQYCKSALVNGIAPHLVTQTAPVGEIVPQSKSPLPWIKNARPGEILIWNILEPDETYHTYADESILIKNVNAQFDNIADKIKDIITGVPNEMNLRIVITSDHGRMKSKSIRKIVVPPNMISHGRAAWGESNLAFDARGYLIDGDLVFIQADRFGLPKDACMPIRDDTFLTSDGKSGEEAYSHGGMFPEEVLVPWIEFALNVAKPQVEVTVTGSGYAENRGKLIIEVLNLSAEEVIFDTLEVDIAGQLPRMERLDWKVKPRDQEIREVDVNWWPTQKQARQIQGVAHFVQGRTTKWMQPCIITLESKELYSTDNPDILAGL